MPFLQIKSESKSAPTTPSGHKSSHHHRSHHSSSSSSHRDKDRHHHRSSHHHRRKRYNVGVQCKIGDKQISAKSSSSGVSKCAGFSLANPCPSLEGSVKYKYGHLMRVETYPNGGGRVLHMWQSDYAHFSEAEQEELAHEFVEVNPFEFCRHFFSQ